MKKLLLLVLLILPQAVWGITGIRIKSDIYEKIAVSTSASNYPDSLVENYYRRASYDIGFFTHGLQRTVKVTTSANVWRYLIAASGDFKVLSAYKPVNTTAGARIQGFAEVEQKYFNKVTPDGQPVFSQRRTGDSLWIDLQPTPLSAESVFVQSAYFTNTFLTDTADADENILPAPYDNWVAYLAALRLLSREAPYRNDVIQQLWTEFQQAVGLFRPDLVERLNDLYVLPMVIKETESKAK